MIDPTQERPDGDLVPGLSAPARRALAGAGYTRLEQLTQVNEAEIKHLHGIGPNAMNKLKAAMSELGLGFAPAN
jgi:predicted RecB family nuclease